MENSNYILTSNNLDEGAYYVRIDAFDGNLTTSVYLDGTITFQHTSQNTQDPDNDDDENPFDSLDEMIPGYPLEIIIGLCVVMLWSLNKHYKVKLN